MYAKIISIVFILAINSLRADFCPVLKLNYKNIFEYDTKSDHFVYKYKQVDPIIMSPFYGSEENTFIFKLFRGAFKGYCAFESDSEILKDKIILLSDLKFTQNKGDNRIKLNYSATSGVYCGFIAQMKEIWLIDYANSKFVSFYGCQMALSGGVMSKFEGVLVLGDKEGILESNLTYTYDILKSQANISLESLKSHSWNYKIPLTNDCIETRNQMNFCKNFDSRKDRKKLDKLSKVVGIFMLAGCVIIIFMPCFQKIWDLIFHD